MCTFGIAHGVGYRAGGMVPNESGMGNYLLKRGNAGSNCLIESVGQFIRTQDS